MNYHDELLRLAADALRDDAPPLTGQAAIRRTISTAYYALFHLLTSATAERLVGSAPEARGLRATMRRAFGHVEMKDAAKGFASGRLSPKLEAALRTDEVPVDLAVVATSFVNLQSKRHTADYDLSADLLPSDAREAVILAVRAGAAWERVRDTEPARVFLVALLLLRSIRQ